MVEHNLAKVGVASSNLVSRSNIGPALAGFFMSVLLFFLLHLVFLHGKARGNFFSAKAFFFNVAAVVLPLLILSLTH